MQVSQAFKDNVYAPSRQTHAKVIFELVNPEAYNSHTFLISGEASISRKEQVLNRVRGTHLAYATFEPSYWLLDGSFHIPPKITEGSNELGWWSDVLSNADGTYTSNPYVRIDFDSDISTLGTAITFDDKANEYPTKFTLRYYDSGGSLIQTTLIENNTTPFFVWESKVDNYRKISIEIRQWVNGNRRARITEIDIGLVKEYTNTEIVNIDIVEELDLLGNVIPSNELRVTLDNADKAFNISNPEGFYAYLMEQQIIKCSIGISLNEENTTIEYVPMGQYFLNEWQSDEGAMTVTFTARDIFNGLESVEYTTLLRSTTLYALAESVLADADISDYQIDNRLQSILTDGFVEKLSIREALQYISIAGACVIYQNRSGTIIVKQFEALTSGTGYLFFAGPDIFTGQVTLEVDSDFETKIIDFDNVFAEPQIILAETVYAISIAVRSGESDTIEYMYYNQGVKKGAIYKYENPLITTKERADAVAEWMFREYNLRLEYTANWRQNPSFECGEAILIEDSFGQRKRSRIIRQNFNYEGTLTGTTETKGGA